MVAATKIQLKLTAIKLAALFGGNETVAARDPREEYLQFERNLADLSDITSMAFNDFYSLLTICFLLSTPAALTIFFVRTSSAFLGALAGTILSFATWAVLACFVLQPATWVYAVHCYATVLIVLIPILYCVGIIFSPFKTCETQH